MNTKRTIVFGRHAKSSWADPGQADFDRPLNERGRRDAPAMAARLLETGLSLECILSSSARRAMETAAAFAQAAGINVVAVNALYHAEPDAYLNALRELPETVMQVAVFGHNPGMSMIAHNIAPARAHEVPTCGLIVAEADTTSWSDLDWVDLKWVAFMTPKDGSDA